ncbi:MULTISPECIES: hypothetical protein [unclassified Colwellia]|uniref:hypothetical protein n=1 Tax=unclassified Colwellia TaxID=196834 RepID=UPI0015F3A460|nr:MULTISPECIES: hypothetical protein [unclassified Colwellia]MBA6233315.1 hypothetical protein [Colwellia sp. MB02u-7]MBA6236405.1 hypothetical protein [Colwellia sp. MB02u-11]MBA6256939.1 hypothetical protein [Colwellia sp. MB3u-28]MBA6261055.1 hypothetical protein [Colwellia sp. MB3u-41]MBA6298195.1 hypothetical protein [Colwellia sp. MB3u-22]
MKVLLHLFMVICISILLMGATKWGKTFREGSPPSDFYYKTLYSWGKHYDDVVNKNGTPNEIIENPIRNETYKRLDKNITLKYDEISIQFYVYDYDKYDDGSEIVTRKLFQKFNLTGCGESLSFSSITCNGEDELIRQLGKPSRIEGFNYIYMVANEDVGVAPMIFTIPDDKVTKIEWQTSSH